MATPRTKKEKKPITFSLQIAGQDQLFDTDNVLEALRSLSIDPFKIKSMAKFDISYQGRTFSRVLKIPMMRMLLVNDTRRMLFAKNVNQTLGISVENYN